MTKYSITIGLLDKDSKVQEVSTVSAYKMVNNFLTIHIGFGTVLDANGVYTHEDGTVVTEPSIRVEITDVFNSIEEASIMAFIKDVKYSLNQESVLFEKYEITGAFI